MTMNTTGIFARITLTALTLTLVAGCDLDQEFCSEEEVLEVQIDSLAPDDQLNFEGGSMIDGNRLEAGDCADLEAHSLTNVELVSHLTFEEGVEYVIDPQAWDDFDLKANTEQNGCYPKHDQFDDDGVSIELFWRCCDTTDGGNICFLQSVCKTTADGKRECKDELW